MLKLTIGDDWQKFIEGKLRAGHFASAEEVVGEGLRALKEQDEFLAMHQDDIREKIEAGMESLRRGDFVDGEEAMDQLERELVEEIGQGR